MPGAGRLRDVSRCTPHGATGPSITSSKDVIINDRGALRVGDRGTYPCSCKAWRATDGAPGVYINKRRLHRLSDADDKGHLASASEDVTVGDHVAEEGKREPKTWASFLLMTTGTGRPRPGVLVKMRHAGKEYVGRTDEVGQFFVDGLPLEPKTCSFEVPEDVMDTPEKLFEHPEDRAPDPDEDALEEGGGFTDFSFLLAGDSPPSLAAPRAQSSSPEVHAARGQAFLARGDRGAAAASLQEALRGYAQRGDRASAAQAQQMLTRLETSAR